MKDTHSNNSYVELQIQICNLYLEIRGLGLQGVVACLASRMFRRVRFPQAPYE